MKKSCIVLVLFLAVFTGNAQWKVTPEVGMSIFKSGMYNAGVGVKIGVSTRYSFNGKDEGFALRSGLYYMQRNAPSYSGGEILGTVPGKDGLVTFPMPLQGFNSTSTSSVPENAKIQNINMYQIKTRQDYLQLPLMAEYGWKISPDIRYHIAAGPYVAVGISGRSKTWSTSWNLKDNKMKSDESTKNAFIGAYDDRFDAGGSFQTGLEVKQFAFLLNYDINLYKRSSMGKGHLISMGIGYTF